MNLTTKIQWSTKDNELWTEFLNIKNWANAQDSGFQPWTRFYLQGSMTLPVRTLSSAYTLSDIDQAVLVDSTSGPVTITLPSAVNILGRQYTIKDWKGQSATNNITIASASGQKIDGASTYVISVNYLSYTMTSDGANWSII